MAIFKKLKSNHVLSHISCPKLLLENQSIIRVGNAENSENYRAFVVAETVNYYVIDFLEVILFVFRETKKIY
jgi:hypothetical protein